MESTITLGRASATGAPSADGAPEVVEAAGRRPSTRRRWTWITHTDALGPVVVVAFMLAVLIFPVLIADRGNPTEFVRFGREFASYIHPPPGAVVETAHGYDGQYFWALARDPLLLHARTLDSFRGQGFRLQRVAYPALAYILSAGNRYALPWVLLALNVLLVLAVTAGFSRYARAHGRSGWWGLAVGLLPGLMFATLGDLSDVLAVASMLGGLMMWQQRRRWPAAGFLTVAALAREAMLLAVVAVAIEASIEAWSAGPKGRLRRVLASAWPVAAIPALAFGAWQVYIRIRFAGPTAAPSTAYQPPLMGIIAEVRRSLGFSSVFNALWDLTYLGLMLAGTGVALARLRRAVSAPAIAALLFGLSLCVLSFGDEWSYTRLSAPLFGCLLLGGLQWRSRSAIGICLAVSVLGAVTPFAIA